MKDIATINKSLQEKHPTCNNWGYRESIPESLGIETTEMNINGEDILVRFWYPSNKNYLPHLEWCFKNITIAEKEAIKNEEHTQLFNKWVMKNNVKVYDKITDVPGFDPKYSHLEKGMKVTFTNDYGIPFENLTILGFSDTISYGRCVYLNFDCYWCAVKPESLTLTK